MYLIGSRPLHSSFENRNEMFNEITIYTCSLLLTVFLNIAIPLELKNIIGWAVIGVASFNIFINLCLTVRVTLKGTWKSWKLL